MRIISGCSTSPYQDIPEQGEIIALTPAEQEWVQNHPVILSAPDPDFPPAEFFDESGVYKGLVADYLNIISQRVGFKLNILRLDNLADVLNHAREKRIELVTAASRTPQRESFLDFSEPFIKLPAVIIVRQQVNQELTLDKLRGMTVSVVHQYAVHDYLVQNYPHLNLDLVSDIQTGLPSYLPAAWYKDDRVEGWRDYFVYKLPSNEIVTVYSDETDRKVAETALRESEEKFAGIIHSVNDHMVMLDEKLNILWANNTAKKTFGDSLVDKKCYEIFAGICEPCENCIAEQCFRDGLMKEHEIKLEKQNDSRFDFWETTNPILFT